MAFLSRKAAFSGNPADPHDGAVCDSPVLDPKSDCVPERAALFAAPRLIMTRCVSLAVRAG
jgi:hypothetical protein